MYGYEKTVLYIYPRAEYLKKLYRKLAENKMQNSYRNPNTEKLTEEVILCYFLEKSFEKWRKRTEEILNSFSEEELCLFEYKYFRRKSILDGKYKGYAFPFSYSSFFRHIRSLTKRFALRLRRPGFFEKDFRNDFSECDLVMNIYKKAESGKDECYLRGKECSFVFIPRVQSS